jgi:phosphoglucosamine mutase
MITALSLLRVMIESGGKSLKELTAGFARYPQILLNVRVGEKKPFEEMPEVLSLVSQTETELGDRGRLLLRYSGTERLARVMIEGEDQSLIERQAHGLADAIRGAIGEPQS